MHSKFLLVAALTGITLALTQKAGSATEGVLQQRHNQKRFWSPAVTLVDSAAISAEAIDQTAKPTVPVAVESRLQDAVQPVSMMETKQRLVLASDGLNALRQRLRP